MNTELIWESVVRANAAEAARHARDEEPRARQRQRQEAVAAEGHRPRARRVDPQPAVAPRRHGVRAAAAQLRLQLPKKVERGALRAALAQKMKDGALVVVDELSAAEIKTKAAVEMLKRLGVRGKAVLVDVALDEKLARSVRNVPGIAIVQSRRLTARDVMDAVAGGRHARRAGKAAGGAGVKLTDVIRRPLITEKTSILREDGRTIVFQVAPGANKIEIKRAVEQLLGSKVASIRTSIAHGKVKRQGRFAGRRSDWKKAFVKLREGEKMPEFLEGA